MIQLDAAAGRAAFQAGGDSLIPATKGVSSRVHGGTGFLPQVLLWVAFAFVVGLAVNAPVRRVGDGHEYHAMTRAIADFRLPSYTVDELDDFKRWLNTQPPDSVFPGASVDHPRLVAQGRQDFPHFWFYSLMAAPFLAVFGQLGMHANYGFLALNALLLGVALWQVARATSPLVALVLLATPVVWYVNKAHTEVFTFAVIAISLARSLRRDYLTASLAAAIGSTQNPPILGLAFLFWGVGLVRRYRRTRSDDRPAANRSLPLTRRTVALVGTTLFFCVLAPAYYLSRLGTITPLSREGYSLQFPSLREYSALLVDPDLGMLFWVPFIVVLTVLGCAALARRRAGNVEATTELRVTAGIALAAGALFLLTFPQIGQVNHGGSVYMSRYALWLIPLALPMLAALAASGWERVLLAVGLGTLALYASAFNPAQAESHLTASPQARLLYDCVPCAYQPLSEVFFERRAGVTSEIRPGMDTPTGIRGGTGSAANETCQLILLDRSSPVTRCQLTVQEWQLSNDLFRDGWRSVWISRAGTLGVCPARVVGNDRASQSDSPAASLNTDRELAIETLMAPTRSCTDAGCRAFGGVDLIRSIDGGVEVIGWVAFPVTAEPAKAVLVLFGNEPVIATRRDQPRPDVAAFHKRPDLTTSGFRAVVPYARIASLVSNGTACPTAIRAITADGAHYSDIQLPPTSCAISGPPSDVNLSAP